MKPSNIKEVVNPFEPKKDSLTELALKITQRNIEKQKNIYTKDLTRNKSKRKYKKKTNFNIVKMDDGSIVHFIPGSMHEKGFIRKMKQNINEIEEFIKSEKKNLKL